MVNGQEKTDPLRSLKPTPTGKQICEDRGDIWDEQRKTCQLPGQQQEAQEASSEARQKEKTRLNCIESGGTWDSEGNNGAGNCIFPASETGPNVPKESVETPAGTFLGLSKTDIELLKQQQGQVAPLGEAARQQQLVGQIGQFDQLPISPTGLNIGEAVTTGFVDAIPNALKLGGAAFIGGAAIGAGVGAVAGGPAAPVTAPVAGLTTGTIAGIATFIGSLSSSMISNFKSQRTDTTTAQQRVLDEGKQTMQDWATAAASDPSNRAFYVAQYNKQSAQIDQAYRQMILDTNADVAKFETSVPSLAEFNSFYSDGGERDVLDFDLEVALDGNMNPEIVNFRMIEMANRRSNE